MKQALIKFGSRWLLSLLLIFTEMGCLPRVEFWIANESNAEYKIEILFKKKYTLEGFNALFGYKIDRPIAVARTPAPSYDDMFFQSDMSKKDPNRLTETDFQYNPITATFYYTLRPKNAFLLEQATSPNDSRGIELIQELKFISKDGEIIYRGKEIRKLFLANKNLTIVLK
ncbi:MAG TPA: hypothetical protein PLG41_15195 [Leptospiraceae bacterium]|nr:hypothetical protein [Leptospiraceae bacterium]